jgi:MFS family permease
MSAPVFTGRDFRLFWAGQTISTTGSAVTSVALPLVVVQTLHADAFTMGLLHAAIWLPWMLFGLPAGAWADRVTKRPVMIACQLLAALLVLTVPVAAWSGWLTVEHVLLVALAMGAVKVLFTAAYNAYVPVLVGREHLMGANARLLGTEQVANVAGPGLGGALAQFAGAVVGLVADAVSFLVSALCLRAVRTREPAVRRNATTRLGTEIRAAVEFLVRDPYLRVLAGQTAAANLVLAGVQALLVVFLVQTAGLGAWSVGAVTVAAGVGGLLGAVLAPRLSRRVGTARALLVSSPVTGVFGLLFPLAAPGAGIVLAMVGALAWSTGVVTKNVITGSFRQAYCPPEMVGRVVMTIRFLIFGVMPAGGLLGGLLGTVLDVRTALWILLGANVLAGLALFLGPIRHARELPIAPHLLEKEEVP